jgi:hypothetical protein
MKKSVLTALISVGLLAETAVPVVLAVTSKTRAPRKVSGNRNRGRRRTRNLAIGAAGGAAGGALLGRGRGAGVGAVVGGTAGALMPTGRRRR